MFSNLTDECMLHWNVKWNATTATGAKPKLIMPFINYM